MKEEDNFKPISKMSKEERDAVQESLSKELGVGFSVSGGRLVHTTEYDVKTGKKHRTSTYEGSNIVLMSHDPITSEKTRKKLIEFGKNGELQSTYRGHKSLPEEGPNGERLLIIKGVKPGHFGLAPERPTATCVQHRHPRLDRN